LSELQRSLDDLRTEPGGLAEGFVPLVVRAPSIEGLGMDLSGGVDLYKKIVQLSPDAVLVIDANQAIRLFNPAAAQMFGYSADEIVGRSINVLIDPTLHDLHDGHIRAFVRGPDMTRSMTERPEVRGLRRNGESFPVEISIAKFQHEGDHLYIAIIRDATERHRVNAELRRLATVDGLTGCVNRSHFQGLTERELARAQRYRRPFSLIAIDLDRFKRVNDSYGHAVGDAVLVTLVRRIEQVIRVSDVLGRMGGEEFDLLLPETGLAEACRLAERLRRCLADRPMDVVEGGLLVTASFGVVSHGGGEESLDALLKRADDALYRAKAAGRNRVEVL
jgi:diguanylate cyclase (GGDEF)-like protein/PAS domain S-box-containing protein